MYLILSAGIWHQRNTIAFKLNEMQQLNLYLTNTMNMFWQYNNNRIFISILILCLFRFLILNLLFFLYIFSGICFVPKPFPSKVHWIQGGASRKTKNV